MIVNLTAADFEQGSITSNGNEDSGARIRTGYIPFTGRMDKVKITVSLTSGQTAYIDFLGYTSAETAAPLCDLYWYDSPHAFDLTSYENIQYFRLVLKKSNNVFTPDEVLSCIVDAHYDWYIGDDGLPTNENFIECPEKSMDKPYPHALWRIEADEINDFLYDNNGLPYNILLPELRQYKFSHVFQNEYITVYGHLTKQNDFDNNGLAVLQPISCTVNEELNGEYSLQITLPIDEIGKWTYLKEMNYIKAMGQIFRINQVEYSENGKNQQVSANAVHCFYIWNDWAIEPESRIQFFSDENGKTSIESLINGMRRAMWVMSTTPEQGVPVFTYTSDINDVDPLVASAKWGKIGTLQNVGTATELIMGNDGFIANFGGEIYRDNFYFSINKKMENSDDSAFNIRIGYNLKGIKRKVDISTACTYLNCRDNFGQEFAVSYTPDSIAFVAHPITRRIDFQYDEPNMNLLASDAMKYWYQHGVPLISYTIDLEDVSNNSDFREFTGKPQYKAGNSGTIYDERLGAPIKLKITKTKTDAITGKVVSVTFGASRQFAGYNVNTQIIEYDVPLNKTKYLPLRDIRGRTLKTHDGYKLMKKTEV